MSKFECVLFDLDGTLFDTSEGIMECYRAGLEHFRIYVNDNSELNKVIGPSLYTSYREFFGLEENQVNEAVRIYRKKYNSEGIYKCRMYDGIDNVLNTIKLNGVKLCTATSKPQIMAQKILKFSGLDEYFNVICGAELDGSRSDKVELINTALKLCGFTDKGKAVMIGDRFYDIKGAIDTGIHSIGVTYGFGERYELAKAGAEYIVNSPGEIIDIVLN